MMNQTIPNTGFMNNSVFWIKDVKTVVRVVMVTIVDQVVVKLKNPILKMPFKLLNILPGSFP